MANRPERPPMLRFTREEFSGSDAEYDAHIKKCDDWEKLRMSEQGRAIAKLEFQKQGKVITLNEGEKFSGVSSVPPSVMLKRILKTNTDELLAKYDQDLLDDWDRRFNESE